MTEAERVLLNLLDAGAKGGGLTPDDCQHFHLEAKRLITQEQRLLDDERRLAYLDGYAAALEAARKAASETPPRPVHLSISPTTRSSLPRGGASAADERTNG